MTKEIGISTDGPLLIDEDQKKKIIEAEKARITSLLSKAFDDKMQKKNQQIKLLNMKNSLVAEEYDNILNEISGKNEIIHELQDENET